MFVQSHIQRSRHHHRQTAAANSQSTPSGRPTAATTCSSAPQKPPIKPPARNEKRSAGSAQADRLIPSAEDRPQSRKKRSTSSEPSRSSRAEISRADLARLNRREPKLQKQANKVESERGGKSDGARDAANRQMNLAPGQHVGSITVTVPNRKRLLTPGETLRSRPTFVRLRSVSLSELADRKRASSASAVSAQDAHLARSCFGRNLCVNNSSFGPQINKRAIESEAQTLSAKRHKNSSPSETLIGARKLKSLKRRASPGRAADLKSSLALQDQPSLFSASFFVHQKAGEICRSVLGALLRLSTVCAWFAGDLFAFHWESVRHLFDAADDARVARNSNDFAAMRHSSFADHQTYLNLNSAPLVDHQANVNYPAHCQHDRQTRSCAASSSCSHQHQHRHRHHPHQQHQYQYQHQHQHQPRPASTGAPHSHKHDHANQPHFAFSAGPHCLAGHFAGGAQTLTNAHCPQLAWSALQWQKSPVAGQQLGGLLNTCAADAVGYGAESSARLARQPTTLGYDQRAGVSRIRRMGHTIDGSLLRPDLNPSPRLGPHSQVNYRLATSSEESLDATLAKTGQRRGNTSSPNLAPGMVSGADCQPVWSRCAQDSSHKLTFRDLTRGPVGEAHRQIAHRSPRGELHGLHQHYRTLDSPADARADQPTRREDALISLSGLGAHRAAERRLPSIAGSDGELCKRSPQATAAFSSSSSLSSGANLIRTNNLLGQEEMRFHGLQASVANARRRLDRQPSSTTSETSSSQRHHHENAFAGGGGGYQARSVKPRQLQTGANDSGQSQSRRSDGRFVRAAEFQAARPNQSQAAAGVNQSAGQRPPTMADATRQQWDGAGTKTSLEGGSGAGPKENGHLSHLGAGSGQRRLGLLAASGKSKSVSHPHSPIRAASALGKVSLAGAKRRLGFKLNRGLNSLSVHRSEEVFPSEASELLARQYTSTTTTTTTTTTAGTISLNDSCELEFGSRWLAAESAAGPSACFVEGLGVGQIASRQALVSPYLGDIQVSLSDRRGMLEVEIIRVRQLQPKPYAKRLPSVYVKVYLMRNKKCLAKFKTSATSHTLDPLYQQTFIFRDDYANCVLQIIVWGDYGKNDRKSLMGIVQVHLNDLDMSNVVVGWYKLFNAPSMVANAVASSSKSLRQTLSTTKLVDLTGVAQQQQQHSQRP